MNRRSLLSPLLTAAMAVQVLPPAQAQQLPAPQTAQLPPMNAPVNFDNTQRIRDLRRAGNIYLSLHDALALAIENNLDVELQRYTLQMGDAELLRAQGGGVTRGYNYALAETPSGVGGPLSPLVVNTASNLSATNGTSVATNATELGLLAGPQTNYSVQGTVPQSTGPALPVFDPAVVSQLFYNHQTTLQTNPLAYGAPSLNTATLQAAPPANDCTPAKLP